MARWITVWGQAHTDVLRLYPGKRQQTVRTVLPVGISGSKLRLRFANFEGNKTMGLSAVTVCLGDQPIRQILFSGKTEALLLPNQDIYSDPLEILVERGTDITISLAMNGCFSSGNTPNEVVQISKPGNYAHCLQMPLAGKSIHERLSGMGPVLPALNSVEVYSCEEVETIVCFGDSITRQGHWTNPLREMLFQGGYPVQLVNKGIGGNRILRDALTGAPRYGRSGMKRFRQDVLEQPGVSGVILAMGTNDLGFANLDGKLENSDADCLIRALSELTNLAREAKLQVYAATVTPRVGSENWSEEKEIQRKKLNDWIQNSNCFDGVLDFDAVTRDSREPGVLAPACDSGDHLHPGPMGGKRMAKEAYRVLTENREKKD